MNHPSSAGRRRLTGAVALVLALTAGAAVTASPALAAPRAATTAPTAAEEQAGLPALGTTEWLDGGGPTGFLTGVNPLSGPTGPFRWYRAGDGTPVTLPQPYGDSYPKAGGSSDRVAVRTQPSVYRILDMAAGTSTDIDTAFLGGSHLELLADDTLVLEQIDRDTRVSTLHLVSRPAGTVVHHRITGLPADASVDQVVHSSPGILAVQYWGTVGGTKDDRLAVVDLATGKVVEDRPTPRFYPNSGIAVTADHLAWSEWGPDGIVTLVTARRGETGTTRHASFRPDGGFVPVSLLGDWLVYGQGEKAVAAVSLIDGTTVGGLLTNSVSDLVRAGDDLLAQGNTAEHGGGVYRIALGPDGRPAATRAAAGGPTAPAVVVDEQTPATAGFGTAGAKAALRWRFDRSDLTVDLVVRHKATGRTWTSSQPLQGTDTEALFTWDGTLGSGTYGGGIAAYNGAYEWKLTTTAYGPVTTERTGTLTVASGTAPHDYSDSGTPDLLVRDGLGRLVSYDVRQITTSPQDDWERTDRGGGWHVYDRLVSAGNLDASPYADVLARRKDTGDLWLYPGTGHSLAKPLRVGGGWNAYDKLAAGSDVTGDGRPDLVATDRTGVAWLYKATGVGSKPFAPRVRIGGGWNTYDLLTAPGDLGGAKTGDLLARDRSGVLWLYLGKGDGTFAPRVRVGGGWGVYGQVVNIGDADRDGRADLIAESGGDTRLLTVYKGTGDWRAPFGRPTTLNIPVPYTSPYGTGPVVF
ncbi:FG-GAP repeat domain-containing protein [Streptomyces sp. NRRL F-5727]|uniref:FG-GAP repeat domain-containing protein n=1 Tax=Streptomyces sp. NRRL F-5727 TaxID=1463871 RepID=UPI0004C9B0B8|nr:VCBS repeat-containing protein [Streptomyces sp. NRRL F-5727]